jgi:hypothetical protein
MSRLRIVAIAAAIALVGAIFLAAVWPPSEPWANGTLCGAFSILGIAAIGAIFSRGSRQAYCTGFAVFGLSYLGLILGPWCTANIAPRLITETALKALQDRYGPYPKTQSAVLDLSEHLQYAPRQIGHALFSLLLGMLGGAAARWFVITSARNDPSAATEYIHRHY